MKQDTTFGKMGKRKKIRLKMRLFVPVAFIIVLVISTATILSIQSSIETLQTQIRNNLTLEVQTITKMFERERSLKLEKVKTNLKVAHELFYSHHFSIERETFETKIINQNTLKEQQVILRKWKLNNSPLYANNSFVDSLGQKVGGTITIFQRIDSGFVRISTNVLKSDSTRAVGTYIPNDSPVAQSVIAGKTFYGRAFVVNDWYITAYEPIYHKNKIIGMLYVGDKEKDLIDLRKTLSGIKIGKSGYPFVFDKNGKMLIHPYLENQNWRDSSLFRKFTEMKTGVLNYTFRQKNKMVAFNYYPEFEFYIATCIETGTETNAFIKKTILGASMVAIVVIFILSFFLYFLTTDRIYQFLKELEINKKNLTTTKKALEQSEERFQKLFDSTGDDIFVTDSNESIIEVNQAVCKTLGYSRDELLQMKMSDIRTEKFASKISDINNEINERGQYTFESEHITKDGRIISVEISSRLVKYNYDNLILSIARNISERKEIERQILSAVIRGEEKERERFAKDMHDGLGPLLSTIKLYVSELKSNTITNDERAQYVGYTNELIDDAINSTRTISNNLMPRIIHNYGLKKAVEAFCEKINKTNTISIDFKTKNIADKLEQNLELILFRVISELINNTIKHSQAMNIDILLFMENDKIHLDFKDNGIGFDVDTVVNSDNIGMGLKNIVSRIKSINGIVNFDSEEGNGFSISIEIDV